MTEISKIKINNNDLLIKDATARNNIISLSTDIILLSTSIISLSSDIISLSTTITSLSTNVKSLSTTITSLSTNVKSLSTTITSLSTSITSLSSNIKNYLPLTGGTLTNTLYFKNSNMDITANSLTVTSNPASNIVFRDKNNSNIAFIQVTQDRTDARSVIKLAAKKDVNGTVKENALTIRMYDDGKYETAVSNSTSWRNALGATNGIWQIKEGGTGCSTSYLTASFEFFTTTNATIPKVNSASTTITARKWGRVTEITTRTLEFKSALTKGESYKVGKVLDFSPPNIAQYFTGASGTNVVTCILNTSGELFVRPITSNLSAYDSIAFTHLYLS